MKRLGNAVRFSAISLIFLLTACGGSTFDEENPLDSPNDSNASVPTEQVYENESQYADPGVEGNGSETGSTNDGSIQNNIGDTEDGAANISGPVEEEPGVNDPVVEEPEVEEPVVEEPVVEEPVVEEPVVEEEPVEDEPVVEEPVVEEPVVEEEPVEDEPVDPGLPVNPGASGFSDYEDVTNKTGYVYFRDNVQPILANQCGDCHLGQRFAFASLTRSGNSFSQTDTVMNYRTFSDLISLDKPELSRILAKILPENQGGIAHHGGAQVSDKAASTYQILLEWAELEKSERCPDCGTTANKAYIAYVRQPKVFWMIERSPLRTDRGIRRDAKIMLQRVDPEDGSPIGNPIDFLAGASNGFCADGDCDFGHMSANHAGDTLVFECRVPVKGEPWLERSWNICIAGINAQGYAVDPRFLVPERDRHHGIISSRVDPLGILPDSGNATYDKHFVVRSRNDLNPIFSPDDSRVIFASQRPDPRSGVDAVQTYHGVFYLDNIISTSLQGLGAQTIYRNEGGTADLPFWLYNGRIAFHTWNLERMDRHMYVQADSDGMMEIPVLGGNLQGPNMWGKAFQSNNGVIFGMTGRRRGELETYAPFVFDHTLGIEGINDQAGFKIIPEHILDEIGDYPNGYCKNNGPATNANSPNCHISQLILEASYMPDGRALVTHNPEKTYIGEGERFTLNYARGSSAEARQESAELYLPRRVGISALDQDGNLTRLIPNENTGFIYRYPAWVGKRQHPRVQRLEKNGDNVGSELHIADFSLWLLFGYSIDQNKNNLMNTLDRISSVRVLRKINENSACLQDHKYIGSTLFESNGYHPTALGYIDATGYEQFVVPARDGGNEFGDVPLEGDRSVKLRVPAGELLLLQGVDDQGRVIAQRDRLFSLPEGRTIDTAVKRSQFDAQCGACHGVISGRRADAQDVANQPAVLSFDTQAKPKVAVDLLANSVQRRELTFLKQVRPILDAKCVSCHSAERHEGELSLQAEYSDNANYMPASWENSLEPSLVNHMASKTKIRAYNASVPYSYYVGDKQTRNYQDEINSTKPLGKLAPWDSGYHNLFRDSGVENGKAAINFYYLSGRSRSTNFGRARSSPSNSSRGYLLEVLTGEDGLDPKTYNGEQDHTDILTEKELRILMSVLDVGMPYMARCDDKIVPSGRNAGLPWGDAF